MSMSALDVDEEVTALLWEMHSEVVLSGGEEKEVEDEDESKEH